MPPCTPPQAEPRARARGRRGLTIHVVGVGARVPIQAVQLARPRLAQVWQIVVDAGVPPSRLRWYGHGSGARLVSGGDASRRAMMVTNARTRIIERAASATKRRTDTPERLCLTARLPGSGGRAWAGWRTPFHSGMLVAGFFGPPAQPPAAPPTRVRRQLQPRAARPARGPPASATLTTRSAPGGCLGPTLACHMGPSEGSPSPKHAGNRPSAAAGCAAGAARAPHLLIRMRQRASRPVVRRRLAAVDDLRGGGKRAREAGGGTAASAAVRW